MFRAINFRNVKYFVVSILISIFTGFISADLGGNIKEVYLSLNKPAFAPPPIVFSIVWIIIYIFIGIAAYLIYKKGYKRCEIKDAIKFYITGLVLNLLWAPIFFRWNLYLLALIWLVALLIVVAITMRKFYNIEKSAGIIFAFYMAWLIFAFVLNFSFYILNR